MSNNLLIIWHSSTCIISHLIVIALSCEVELPIQLSNSVVFLFEAMPLLDIAEVLMELVGKASDEKIEYVCDYEDCDSYC